MPVKIASIICIAAMALPLTACSVPSYRYEITVEVDTPEGVRKGATIVEVDATAQPAPFSAIVRRIHGEPAVIDLGKRGYLFALLRSPLNRDWAKNLFARLSPESIKNGDSPYERESAKVVALKSSHHLYVLDEGPTDPMVENKASQYPLLMRFRNLNDFRTAEMVRPGELAKVYGQGVTLRRVTAQITEAEPKSIIEHVLPWTKDAKKNANPPGVFIETGLSSDIIRPGDFARR